MISAIKLHMLRTRRSLEKVRCGNMEDVDHLYLSYDYLWKIWNDILQWLGFSMLSAAHVVDHLHEFESIGGFHKSRNLVFNLIWLSCAWVIWNEINARVFRQNRSSLQ